MARRTPFGRGHELEYGLKIVERRSEGNEVIAVQCQFCAFIGRETREVAGVKRKRTNNFHMFRLPFRQELYRKHLESVHAQDWIAYKAFSPEEKRAFFDEKQRSGIHAFLDSTKESITFDIPNVAIVDELIDNLFFKPELDWDDEETKPISKASALKLFRPTFDRDEDDMEDGAANEEADRFVCRYAVTITNPLRFWLSIDHVKVGLSFRQAAADITQQRYHTKNVKLMGISDHMVGQYVRVLLAVALQLVSNVICNTSVWAFSLCVNASRDAFVGSAHSRFLQWHADEPTFSAGTVLSAPHRGQLRDDDQNRDQHFLPHRE
jgi:hypothetical protein